MNMLILTILVTLSLSGFLFPTVYGKYIDNLIYDDLSAVLGNIPCLMIFTVKWCDHCRALKSEIKALASNAQQNDDIIVARVDAEEEPAIPQKLGVNGYPSILFFRENYNIREKLDSPVEFTDYRWAEIIAEFVNNETRREIIHIEPRNSFKKWRKRNPYNLGKVEQKEIPIEPKEEDNEGMYSSSFGKLGIREPAVLTTSNFEGHVFGNPLIRYLILFYHEEDPDIHNLLIQWRQANSAFTHVDNMMIGIVNMANPENESLGKRFGVSNTPHSIFFPRCEDFDKNPDCRSPIKCPDDLDDTENIIQYIADRVMVEMGIASSSLENEGKIRTYQLTEEEYLKMKEQGTVFANDPDHVEHMNSIHVATMREKEEL